MTTIPITTDTLYRRATAFEALAAPAAVLDGEGLIVETNAAWRLFERLEGAVADSTGVGVNYLEVCERSRAAEPIAGRVADALRSILTGDRARADIEYPCHSGLGDRWFVLQATAARVDAGTGAVVVHIDVTSRKMLQAGLLSHLGVDLATGLPEDRAARNHIAVMGDPAVATEPSAVVLMSLGGIDLVADRLGQAAADEAVAHLAARARRSMRSGDALFRLSAGELLLVVTGAAAPGVSSVADRLLGALTAPIQIGATEVAIAALVGTAPITRGAVPDEVLAAARSAALGAGSASVAPAPATPPFPRWSPPLIDQSCAPRTNAEPPDGQSLETPGAEDRATPGGTGRDHPVARPAPVPSTMAEALAALAAERERSQLLERRMALLLHRASEVVMVIDPERVISYASPSIRSVLGYEPEAIVGTPGVAFTHPDDQPLFREALTRALLDPEAQHPRVVLRARHLDGSWRWGEVAIANLLHDPAISGVVLNIRDITERFDALRELQSEKATRDAIVARSRDLVVFFDGDGTIAWASPAAEQLLGIEPSELVGRHGLDMVHPDDRARLIEAFGGSAGPGDHVRVEFRIVRPDGTIRWLEEVATNLVDEPAVGVIVGNLRDITDRRATEERVRLQARLLEAVGQPVVATDSRGRISYWNEAATATYGWTVDEAIGARLGELLRPADGWQGQVDSIRTHLYDQRPWKGEIQLYRKDGTVVPVEVSNTPVFDEDHRHVGTIGVSFDLTERHELHERLAVEHRRLADAQASAHLGSFEIDLETGVATRSVQMCRILGLGDELQTPLTFEHIHPDDRDNVREGMEEAIASGAEIERTHRIVRPDGEERWVVSRSNLLHDPDAKILTGTVLDITERKHAEQAIEHLAYHDPLTGLANRMLLSHRLEAALRADPGRGPTVVALLDVDQFKVINDSLGHAVGDAVLQAITGRLEGVLCAGETLARFGGDEFAVVCEGVVCDEEVCDGGAGEEGRAIEAGVAAAERVGDRLLAAFDAPLSVGQRAFQVSVSIGLTLGRPGDTVDATLRDADIAMYHAKASGRKRYELFDEQLQVDTHRRLELETELRSAVERDQLDVAFQPILELSTGRTVGFEALLRWPHPEHGPIGPDEVIPIAEETGLILPIGEWVLDRSLATLAQWRRDGLVDPSVWVAVNLSARQLEHPDLVRRVADALSRAGTGPGSLHLEITESVLMDSIERSHETILALRDLGIGISIDDFGTGYSSLSYLRRLPIDTLKIDRSFISGLGEDTHDTSIVQAIISLARTLHMNVLAEGVEGEAQRAILLDLGCDLGQGFLWSRPVPAADVVEWVASRARAAEVSSTE